MIKLSISVQADRRREAYFGYLKEKLGDVPFLIDEIGKQNIGVWPNCRRAWLAHDKTADYHVVIQDDALICEGFKEKAQEFITKYKVQKRVFNFFFGNRTGTQRASLAEGLATGLIEKKRNAWGVAICLPVKLIPQMIAYCDRLINVKQDDVRISKYLYAIRYNVLYPYPSLIDHRIGDSLVGDTSGDSRTAHWYIEGERAKTQ